MRLSGNGSGWFGLVREFGSSEVRRTENSKLPTVFGFVLSLERRTAHLDPRTSTLTHKPALRRVPCSLLPAPCQLRLVNQRSKRRRLRSGSQAAERTLLDLPHALSRYADDRGDF